MHFMLEQLLSMVKDLGQDQVVNNPEVPNEYNETVMATASESLLGTMQQAIAGGQGEELLKMFNSQSDGEIMANPLAQQVQSGFMDNITSKLGINSKTAAGLATVFIPMIINNMVKRTNSTAQEDSGFSLQGLIGGLIGGGQQQAGGMDISSLIGQFTGGGQRAGGLDIGSLIGQFTGGGQANQQAGGQDMIGNLIKGFFSK
jgi:uncharacterized protein YidB (DUF937 family)